MAGQSLELFFVDGKPDGLLTAEIFNWTGHLLVVPRIQLSQALKRKETGYTGAYILLGDDPTSSLTLAYIGEADDVAARIKSHDANKDWWTTAVLITSTGNSLHKAHVKYLESRLVEQAQAAGTLKLDNQNTPPKPSLSEASIANMEQFLEYLFIVLPAIRVDGFLIKTRPTPKADPKLWIDEATKGHPTFDLRLENGEVDGHAELVDGEFVVLPGAKGRGHWIGVDHNYRKLFEEVVESGAYAGDASSRQFVSAYAFSSPSAAGAVLNGRATAGPIAWTVSGTKKTYKDWEAEQL
jgi:hypothetical protein